jgi:hypothetical protein
MLLSCLAIADMDKRGLCMVRRDDEVMQQISGDVIALERLLFL